MVSPDDGFAAADVPRLLDGDPAAARAFERHFGRLLRVKVRMRNGHGSAAYLDDVVQETLVRVLAALRNRRIEDLDRLGAFVSRTGDHVLSESQRTRARFAPLEQAPEPSMRDDGEDRLLQQQRAQLADRLMAVLSDRDREILRAIFFDEADKDDVCRRFEIDRDHLRVLVCRAKERLRALAARADHTPRPVPLTPLISLGTKDRG